MSWLSPFGHARMRRRARKSTGYRLFLEDLEKRTLLNNRFVVPVETLIDNQTTFATLQAALTTPGLNANDVVQIEPGSNPGTIRNSDLPLVANLTIQGDPAAGLTAAPQFNLTDPVVIGASQSGFTLSGVQVGLVGTGSLTFNANAVLTGSMLVDVSSTALHALTLSGMADMLAGSTLVNDAPLPSGSSLVFVTPSTSGTHNVISSNTFVANAQMDALLSYRAGAAVTISDQVMNNSFVGSLGSNVARLLVVGEPINPVTSSGSIAGLAIVGNRFTDPDVDVEAIELDVTGPGTTVSGNSINLTNATILNRGIVVFAGAAATTTTAAILNNQISTNSFGTGLEIDLGPSATSLLNLNIQGNDFHRDAIGVLVQPAQGTSTAPVSGIDLGGGNQGSIGGNNFRSFSAPATATSGAIVALNLTTSQGIIMAQLNSYANAVTPGDVTGITPGNFIFDPNGNVNETNFLTGNAAFVQDLYEDYLRRAGDTTNPNDAGAWLSLLNNGQASPAAIVAPIARSSEGLGIIVDGLYAKLLGRAPDAAGRAGFIQFLQNGGTVEQAINAIVTSMEFSGSNISDVAYIQSLYYKLLGRFASDAELAGWLNALPTLGRGGVANDFTQSAEFRGDVVQQLYGATPAVGASVASIFPNLLHRSISPTAAEVASWVNSGMDVLSIEVSFGQSTEFFSNSGGQQAGTLPTLPALHRHAPIIPALTGQFSSTVPSTGDVNPYGVAFVPANFPSGGTLQPGDILVANFNNCAERARDRHDHCAHYRQRPAFHLLHQHAARAGYRPGRPAIRLRDCRQCPEQQRCAGPGGLADPRQQRQGGKHADQCHAAQRSLGPDRQRSRQPRAGVRFHGLQQSHGRP